MIYSAENLLAKPRYWNGFWLSTRLNWTEAETSALSVLADANADLEKSAAALGRSPSSIAHRARDTGLVLPPEWSKLIRPKRKVVERAPPLLAYPYIAKARSEHADLLAINALVPSALPATMRADVCQEIMLAVLEGKTTIDELRARQANTAWFLRKFYKDNFEQSGRAVSLTGFDDDDRSYDEIASGIAAREWREYELNDKRRSFDALRTITPPVQLEDTYRSQIERKQERLHQLGFHLSVEETIDILETS